MAMNRAEINRLEALKNGEIQAICDKYDPLIAELHHKFTLEEIISLGWREYEYYAPGSGEESGPEYLYEKGYNFIRVNIKSMIVRSNDREDMFVFCSLDELKEYGERL